MMKLFLSAAVAAMAVLFCLFSPPLIYALSLYFSTTVHKHHMFLLCNGILLLLVQSSGLVSDCREAVTVKNGNRERLMLPPLESMKEEIKAAVQIDDVEERESGAWSSPMVEEMEMLIEEEEEEEEDVASAFVGRMMSREELNKMCDDFISRMKEPIHSEMRRLIL